MFIVSEGQLYIGTEPKGKYSIFIQERKKRGNSGGPKQKNSVLDGDVGGMHRD